MGGRYLGLGGLLGGGGGGHGEEVGVWGVGGGGGLVVGRGGQSLSSQEWGSTRRQTAEDKSWKREIISCRRSSEVKLAGNLWSY